MEKTTSVLKLPKFNGKGREDFSVVLKTLVTEHFRKNGIVITPKMEVPGDGRLYMKAFILFAALALHYYLLVYVEMSLFVRFLLSTTLGLNIAMIGFNVMHDGCHGSFSSKGWINRLAGLSLNLLGGYDVWWIAKHNVRHHTYTNVYSEGHAVDEDIHIPGMRLHEEEPWKPCHRRQHHYWYFVPRYMMTYLWWIFVSDTKRLIDKRVGDYPFTVKKYEWVRLAVSKAVFAIIWLVIPIAVCGPVYLLTFFWSCLVCGLYLALIFQMAHNVEGNEKPRTVDNTIENEFMLHQLETTANFACKSRLLGWTSGGLNFQVEHHLFPRISHVYYPALSAVVREACDVCSVAYNEKPTFFAAIVSHQRHLKAYGVSA